MFDQIQNGFGANGVAMGAREVEEMAKALTAGYGYAGAPGSLSGGSVLMVESLEYTLHSVTWDEKHLRIWPIIPKAEVWNTVHEYNRYTGHGEQYESGGFFDADAQVLPIETNAQFNRQYAKVRYIGCTKVVSHPMTLVRTSVESAVAIEARAGTKWILEQQERQLFMANGDYLVATTGALTGDSADVPTSSLKYDGILKQLLFGDSDTTAQYLGFTGYGGNPSIIYDMLGSVPDEEDFEAAPRIQAENFGMPTHFFMDFKTHADMNRQFQPKERITPMGVINGQAGFVLTQFYSSAGIFSIVPTKFLVPKDVPLGAAQSATGDGGGPYANPSSYAAPATPAISSITAEGDTTSNLTAGTYSYKVSALNNIGESVACNQQTVVIPANNRAVITITGGTGTKYYAIYRAPVGTTTGHKFVGFVKDSNGNGGGVAAREAGKLYPGLAKAFLLQMMPQEIQWMQLAPLMKMNLAVLAPAIRFMVLIYGMPLVYAPKHHIVMYNIGKSA
jgi:hypothetical protein